MKLLPIRIEASARAVGAMGGNVAFPFLAASAVSVLAGATAVEAAGRDAFGIHCIQRSPGRAALRMDEDSLAVTAIDPAPRLIGLADFYLFGTPKALPRLAAVRGFAFLDCTAHLSLHFSRRRA